MNKVGHNRTVRGNGRDHLGIQQAGSPSKAHAERRKSVSEGYILYDVAHRTSSKKTLKTLVTENRPVTARAWEGQEM